jgi:hypothetical protein
MGDVAFMGAVFSLFVAVGNKGLLAVVAGQLVVRFSLDFLRVILPPGKPAHIRTEGFLLRSVSLRELLSAFFAEYDFFKSGFAGSISRQTVSSAIGLHGVDGEIEFLGYRFVACTFIP